MRKEEKKNWTTVVFDTETKEKMQEAADREADGNISFFIRKAVREYLKQHEL